ncbi:hypothetical protein CH253_27640 [Rhodococcus sp. 06-156-3C]|uniref:hypothetical protein n=1 Tax=Nocardiaceae TaxID=85025 RepID=UPI00052308FA|nr:MULTISPECIES: hypothetical protein [Rhodococcus]OZD12452.1 hypothetical protein CH253_27640 [Rhodococcus sp. 06-156-3C]OZD13910.1 hypothetical protein CH280_15225 [Rhodococcus sp. 06-156-4C]OZD21078.1 hypothetical protein CH248_12515 [Rhodococcus sp. 06-156-4a]OZD33809.1 hypothetical protein CH284_19580 [Rhodococcus sp. 06-156-3]OZD36302.1 hypothetical protein CH247_04020 [Rhodococcus sp. 06-156-3b]
MIGRRAFAVGLSLVLVGAGASTASLYAQTRTDELLSQSRSAIGDAADDGAVAVLSYRADSVDADIEHAASFLTGDFLSYYSAFGAESIAPAAKERGIISSATVSASSIVSSSEDSAVALVFVNQNITSTDAPDPKAASSSLRIELDQVDGRWLISKLDPI